MTSRMGLAAAAAVLPLVLAGCGGDNDETPGASSSDPSTPESSPSSSAESPSETGSTPAVAPAAGPALEIDGVRLRAPITWSQVPDRFAFRQAAFPPFHESYVSVYRFPNISGSTLDALGEATLGDKEWAPRARRLEDLVIDDQPVYHLAGPRRNGSYREEFGTVLDDTELQVSFEFAEDEPPTYRQDVIASVLETVDFGDPSVEAPEPGSVPPAPARGPVIRIPAAQLRIPVYWEPTDFPLPTLTGAFPRGVLGTSISLATTPQGDVADLEELGDTSVRAKGWRSRATRLDDVVVDGQPAIHVAGEVNPGEHVEQLALLVDGERLVVTFTFADDEKPAYRDEIVASVVPTIRLAG